MFRNKIVKYELMMKYGSGLLLLKEYGIHIGKWRKQWSRWNWFAEMIICKDFLIALFYDYMILGEDI